MYVVIIHDHGGDPFGCSPPIKSRSLWCGLYHWFRPCLRTRRLQIMFQASFRTYASPWTVCDTQIENMHYRLAQIIKIMIFGEIEIKSDGGCYKFISTGNFFEPFPNWSEPKRVCSYPHCGLRNRLALSATCLDHQNHDFWEIGIKSATGCYIFISTGNFFEPFPNRLTPKRVCPYDPCGSRNLFVKSTVCSCTCYCDAAVGLFPTSKSM